MAGSGANNDENRPNASSQPKQPKYLPVKSSGYGRVAAPSAASSSSHRPRPSFATARSGTAPSAASSSKRRPATATATATANPSATSNAAKRSQRRSTAAATFARPTHSSVRSLSSSRSLASASASSSRRRNDGDLDDNASVASTGSARSVGSSASHASAASTVRSVVSARSIAAARSNAGATAVMTRPSSASRRRQSEMPRSASTSGSRSSSRPGSATRPIPPQYGSNAGSSNRRGVGAHASSPSSRRMSELPSAYASPSSRRMSELPSPSFARGTTSSAIKTRGMSPSPSSRSRRASELMPLLPSGSGSPLVTIGGGGRSASPVVRSGVANSAEIERLARATTSSRMVRGGGGDGDGDGECGGPNGESAWAQQQREKMVQRRQHQEAAEAANPTSTTSTSSSSNLDPASVARYDEINQSLRKRSAPPNRGGSNNLLDRIEEDERNAKAAAAAAESNGSSKRIKIMDKSSIPSSPSISAGAAFSAAKMDLGGGGGGDRTPSSKLLGKFGSPAAAAAAMRTPGGSTKRSAHKKSRLTTPSSYRKTVALSGGAATPTVVRELFDNKSKSVLAELADFDPSTSTTRSLSDSIFATGSGISDDEIRRLLTSKASTTAARWELKKQLEASTALIKRLKDMVNDLKKGKNKFVAGAIEAERTARAGWARSLHKCKELDDDRTALKKFAKKKEEEAVILRDEAKDARRDLDQSAERVRCLDGELGSLREKLTAAEKAHSEINVALAVAEARAEEAAKQADGWREQMTNIEKSKLELLQKSEVEASQTAEKEVTELRQEVASLKSQMQAREEELGRLIGDDIDSSSSNGGESQMSNIKKVVDGLRAELSLRTSDLDKAKTDCMAADARATTASNDMSELARGLQDVQQSSLTREQEANAAKKEAEEKAAEMDRLYTEARHQLSTLNEEKDKLVGELQSTKSDLTEAEGNIQSLKDELAELKTAMAGHSSQIEVEKELRLRAEHAAEEERRERIATSSQMVAMTSEHAKAESHWRESSQRTERELRRQLEEQAKTLQEKETELRGAKETISCLEGERDSLKSSLSEERSMLETRNAEQISQLTGELNSLRQRLKGEEVRAQEAGIVTQGQLSDLEEQLSKSQAERKRLHTLVQELRGNVRVVARVRPFLPDDNVPANAKPCCITNSRNASEMRLVKRGDDGNCNQEYAFSFDRAFPPSSGQEAVFEEVSEFVQSALDGYKVCLFSYGQTGSGKTHTMQGSGNGAMRGIIPRSLEQIGRYKEKMEKDDGWSYHVSCSYLEIYNEAIRDLLRDEKSGETKHDIKVDGHGNRYVTNLTTQNLDPTDPDAINGVMRLAAKHRAVAATDMNQVSSRSHAVFTLYLRATSGGGQKLCSQLNLCDLAGSERLDRSGATGQRAREAMNINKSLSSLSDVFVALGNKSSHVPFRNSKLTYLLQPCLSGDGKTLMLVNCSPTDASAQESLNALRFASQVNQVELGRAKRQVDSAGSGGGRVGGGGMGTPSSKKRKPSTPLSKWSGASKKR